MRRELCLEALDATAKSHADQARSLDQLILKKGDFNTQIKQKLTSLFDHLTPTAAFLKEQGIPFDHPLATVKNNHLLNTKIKIMEYRQILLRQEYEAAAQQRQQRGARQAAS